MSVWKKLNQQDVFVSTYVARKLWTIQAHNSGVKMLPANDQSAIEDYIIDKDTKYTGDLALDSGSYSKLVHSSIKQLYYTNFDSGSGSIIETGSFDNHLESSLTSASRFLSSSAIVYSIPRNKIGTHIEPATFKLGGDGYIIDQEDYVPSYENDYVESTKLMIDDGEGVLREKYLSNPIIGNIVYSHGQVVITDPSLVSYYTGKPNHQFSYKSNLPIYTHNFNIKISDYEFNHTFNPTAQKNKTVTVSDIGNFVNQSGELANNVTGSAFQPYVTTVGLYNDANQLIAVGKLSQPLPKSANTEMTIQVKLDI